MQSASLLRPALSKLKTALYNFSCLGAPEYYSTGMKTMMAMIRITATTIAKAL